MRRNHPWHDMKIFADIKKESFWCCAPLFNECGTGEGN